MSPRVVRNDWSCLAVPPLDGWRPTLTVSVVIPSYQCQSTLDLTLAALSHQTYPAHLLEVIVVDDGSDPPLALPKLRPSRTTLLTVGDSGWGRANALAWGAAHSRGEILHWLDADMVPFPEHVAAQARWHHVLPYAVTLGYKRFVDPFPDGTWPPPQDVLTAFDRDAGEPHTYVERYITQTDQLRTADHLAFRIHVGARPPCAVSCTTRPAGWTGICASGRTPSSGTGWPRPARCSSRNRWPAVGTWGGPT